MIQKEEHIVLNIVKYYEKSKEAKKQHCTRLIAKPNNKITTRNIIKKTRERKYIQWNRFPH